MQRSFAAICILFLALGTLIIVANLGFDNGNYSNKINTNVHNGISRSRIDG
ncbi:hypothetical protein [Apilactobacillus timberlakei]|uniref:hypothetical protein n=1 Tax=Apilactobacillus timberlakei TaxID=2008380 RepID=UPI0015E84349|nr:hypothetical protein [Apilactobacillus timberlakei]